MPPTVHPIRGCVAAVLVVLLACAPGGAQDFPMTVTVNNSGTIARVQEPVTFGFPVPLAAGLLDVAAFRVLGPNQQPLPAQFRALTRWSAPREDPTHPLRWVQATFAASVPAHGATPYTIALGGLRPTGHLSVASTPSAIVVTTSPGTSFTLSRTAFTLFSAVIVGGQSFLSAPGSLELAMAPNTPVLPVVETTTIEESGTVRAVVMQNGHLGVLRFTCRWFFHSDRSDVEVQFRLENPLAYGVFPQGPPGGQQYFDRLYLQLPVSVTSLKATSTQVVVPLATGQAYEQRQTFAWTPNPEDVLAGFSFTETGPGGTLAQGGRSSGGLDFGGSNRGVTVVVDRFWQNFPKSLRIESGAVRVGLFPEWGSGPHFVSQYGTPGSGPPDPQSVNNYRFEGGRWKTHRMVFDFHTGPWRTPAAVDDLAKRVNAPMIGHAAPARLARSLATGILFLERRASWPTESFARHERFLDIMEEDSAADIVGTYGHVGLRKFRDRGGPFGGWLAYGWENFGDLPWADGFCDLHYDWPGSLLLGFLRTGDAALFDVARDLAVFRRDYGQNHSSDVTEYWRGAQFYEKGWWHGNESTGQESHNWLQGLALYYVLTGDEASYEAALQNVAFLLRQPPGQWSGWWGSRIPGWSIDNLLDAHNLLGYPGALAAAGQGVARFEQLEVADGSHGYHLDPGVNPPATAPWLDNIFFNAAARYALLSGDRSHDAFLWRMKTWFKNSCVVLPTGPVQSLTMPHTFAWWAPGTPGAPSIHLCWPMLESLSYSALLFNDPADMHVARVLFELLTRFWQEPPGGPPVPALNPAAYSPITMRPLQYPTTETKVLGNILLWGRVHLLARAFFEGWL